MGPDLLEEITRELNGLLKDGVVSKIHEPDGRTLVFKVFTRGKTEELVISAHPRFSRIHISSREFKNPEAPPRFAAYLRSRILNARMEAFEQAQGERIVRIRLIKKIDGEWSALVLIAELTGKSSNIILCDSEGVVLDALRHFGPGSAREVYPGVALPPLPPPPPMKEAPIEKKEDETWNEAADRSYSALLDEEWLALEKNRLRRVITEACKKAERKLRNLKGDESRALNGLQYESLGEILRSNYGKLKRGMKEIEADDYTVYPPEKVHIALDEKLGPKENLDKFFKRAKRAKTALSLLRGRIPEVEKELEYLASLMYEWESIETKGDLSGLRDELMKEGYIKEKAAAAPREEERATPVRRYTSTEGFEILCGKSGAGNDLIVKEYAKDEDIWFHAAKIPGSHVLIKTAGRAKELTKKTIEEAASICAYYSKAREASKVEVIYTEARHVKKPRGAKPGMVTVREYKSILVRPKAEI
ncbi:MAG: NFACT family protein [Deltaproteobacteria bacterium]|nr:NFACT family protein [Deltaproteobacteria bacterium]